MKKLLKVSSVICAIALLASVFAGCAGKDEAANTFSGTLTYWGVMDSSSSATLGSYSEMMLYQEMEKRTGIKIEFSHPVAGSTGNEAFIAMLTSSVLPDMVEYNWGNYTGGPQQALDDEVIICLDEYLEEYAPNYYDYMNGEKAKDNDYLWKYHSTTEDGRHYGFNILNIGTARCFAGLYVRGDKLREWNMSVPETIDEWTALFAKAKAEGFAKPFTSDNMTISFTFNGSHGFNSAFGVGKELYLNDGKVVFAPFEKGYKEYVSQIADWVKKGYVDTGFVTNDSATIEGNVANGISVAACGTIGGAIGKIMPAAQEKNPEFELVACPYPVAAKGEKAAFRPMSGETKTIAIGITTQCVSYKDAMKWCDYIYSEEGVELQLFGIEGETYTVEEIEGEKHYVYTDKIKNHEGFNSVSEALYHYMLPSNHPGLNQHPDYLNGYYQYQQQRDALEIWNDNHEVVAKNALPPLSYTEEESREKTDILEIAQDALEVALNDIILGKKSIDTYDDAIKQAKENGYDRYIEIAQGAYDRYMSKIDK